MKNALKCFAALLIFAGITVLYTYPMARHLDDGFAYTARAEPGNELVPFTQGDSVQTFYHFWMAWDYVTGGPGPFFRDPYEFKVGQETEGIFTTRRLLLSVLFVLLAPLGTVFAFNMMLLICLALSGWMTFLLAKHYTGMFFPSLVAGLIFGYFPFPLAQLLGGHTNGYCLFLIPFILLCLEKGMSTKKISWIFLSSLGFATFALIEYHLLYFVCMLLPVFYVVRMLMIRPGWRDFFRISVALGIALGIGVGIMFLIKHFEISGSIREGGVSWREIWLYTPVLHHLFSRNEPNMEKLIYLGFIPMAVASLSFLVYGWRRPLFWLYAAIFCFFTILSLGPSFDDKIPLFRWLYDHLPYFSLSRLPGRMIVMAALAMAVLAALGLSRLKKGSYIAVIVFLLIGVEYFPRAATGITLIPGKNNVYEYVKKNNGDHTLLCLPIWPGDTSWSSIYLYYVTQTKVPLVNGYYPVVPHNYVENVFYPLYSMNVGELREEQAELLKKLNVKYIVFHEEAFPQKVSHYPAHISVEYLKNNPHLKWIMQDGPQWLFELLDEPRDVKTVQVHTPVGVDLIGSKLKGSSGLKVDHRIQILPPGKYTARFLLEGEGADGVGIRMYGCDPLKRKDGEYVDLQFLGETKGKQGEVDLDFTLDKGLLVTIQMERSKKEDYDIDFIFITQRGEMDPLDYMESEELLSHGVVVHDTKASKGFSVLGTPALVPKTELVFGPYRLYPPGEYVVRYWVRSGATKEELKRFDLDTVAGRMEVMADFGNHLITEKPLFVSALQNKEEFEPRELSFSLEKDEVLEFRIIYNRKISFFVDRIEVEQKK